MQPRATRTGTREASRRRGLGSAPSPPSRRPAALELVGGRELEQLGFELFQVRALEACIHLPNHALAIDDVGGRHLGRLELVSSLLLRVVAERERPGALARQELLCVRLALVDGQPDDFDALAL